MASNRKITREQFSEDTTIDGSRIERALDDMVERVNAVELGDLARRFVPVDYVVAWSPFFMWEEPAVLMGTQLTWDRQSSVTTKRTMLPFMPLNNGASAANPTRVKGLEVPDIADSENVTNWYVATTLLAFSRPVIVSDLNVFLLDDQAGAVLKTYRDDTPAGHIEPQTGAWKYPYAYSPYSAGDYRRDVHVQFAVDSELAKENAEHVSIELHRWDFLATSQYFTLQAPPAPGAGNDMWPPHPGGYPAGLAIEATNVNVPLHANARARLHLCIPVYEWESTVLGAGGYIGHFPFNRHIYCSQLTVLEEVQ